MLSTTSSKISQVQTKPIRYSRMTFNCNDSRQHHRYSKPNGDNSLLSR